MTNSTPTIAAITLAASWLDKGLPDDTNGNSFVSLIKFDRASGLFASFAAEREDHLARAALHATAKTGYTWDVMSALSMEAAAYDIFRNCEYDRLESAARERRILALSACIQ